MKVIIFAPLESLVAKDLIDLLSSNWLECQIERCGACVLPNSKHWIVHSIYSSLIVGDELCKKADVIFDFNTSSRWNCSLKLKPAMGMEYELAMDTFVNKSLLPRMNLLKYSTQQKEALLRSLKALAHNPRQNLGCLSVSAISYSRTPSIEIGKLLLGKENSIPFDECDVQLDFTSGNVNCFVYYNSEHLAASLDPPCPSVPPATIPVPSAREKIEIEFKKFLDAQFGVQ